MYCTCRPLTQDLSNRLTSTFHQELTILDLRLQQMLSMRCGVEKMVEQGIIVGRAAEAAVGAEAAGEEARWTG